MLTWIADYERWVVDTAGPAHRDRALAETAACCEARLIPAGWEKHARLLGQAGAKLVREEGVVPAAPPDSELLRRSATPSKTA